MKANSCQQKSGRIGRSPSICSCLRYVAFRLMIVGCLPVAGAESAGLPAKAADLYQTTKVWNLHLQFTPEQWQAMEPAESEGGMPGDNGMRFRGPGDPCGPGGPGGFGPGAFLAPRFL